MNNLENRISRLEKFFKPIIEGNITLENFYGFHEDLWMEKDFMIKFKANRNIKEVEVYFYNPLESSGDFEIIVNDIGSKNVSFITSSQKRGCVRDNIDLKKESINVLTIFANLSSKSIGDSRNLTLILEKIVFK